MNAIGPETRGLGVLNNNLLNEQKDVRHRVAGNAHGLSEEEESRINEDFEDADCGSKELVQPKADQQRPQPRSQGSLVRWESFLPLRSLKVLLVENDDSTRHVICALLRNCSYEVAAVASSLEAWKILEDLTYHIDLVLTEVVMPCLSGIGLLQKIMSHKTCKNIPVIMMSSNDSMGIVFKCLSKGAVDFLVKPIRKNELKNLWQHVWRKCHSSSGSGSGSGSESGIGTKKSTKSKSVEGSENNMASNDEDDNESTRLNVRDGSDNGSGTQVGMNLQHRRWPFICKTCSSSSSLYLNSEKPNDGNKQICQRSSWTKRAAEFDSTLPVLPWDQLGDRPDCTCAQVIHSRAEAFSNKWVPTIATRAYIREVAGHDNVAMGKDLGIGIPREPDLQLEDHGKKASSTVAETEKDEFPDLGSENDGGKVEKEKLEVNSETLNKELRKETADLIGAMTHCTNRQMETAAVTVPNDNIKDMAICSTKEITSLELSLKRQRDGGEIGTSAQERNVFRHSSDLSAFSRYNTSSTSYQAPAGNVGSCSPFDNSAEAAKIQPRLNLLSNSNESPNQHSNGSSNNNDMGSTTNNAFTKPESSSEKPNPRSVNNHNHSAFQPVQNGHLSSLPSVEPRKTDALAVNAGSAQARAKHSHVQVQHHHYHYHHHHHHIRNPQQQQKVPNLDVSSLRAPHCEPSHSSSMPIEGNAANYSLKGSAPGSNNGSNGENSRSIAAITGGAKIPTTNNELSENCGGGGGIGSGLDQNHYTQREAALNKFRQKRKERCFAKKVRYHSRKRLAEQRPRVRGQFVRQAWHEDKSNEDKDC